MRAVASSTEVLCRIASRESKQKRQHGAALPLVTEHRTHSQKNFRSTADVRHSSTVGSDCESSESRWATIVPCAAFTSAADA